MIASTAQSFEWGTMEWVAQGEALGVSLAKMNILPGKVSPADRHDNCNEVLHVLSGAVEQRVGEEWHMLSEGQSIEVFAGDIHQTKNVGADDALVMIAYSSGERAYEQVEI